MTRVISFRPMARGVIGRSVTHSAGIALRPLGMGDYGPAVEPSVSIESMSSRGVLGNASILVPIDAAAEIGIGLIELGVQVMTLRQREQLLERIGRIVAGEDDPNPDNAPGLATPTDTGATAIQLADLPDAEDAIELDPHEFGGLG